VENFGSYAYPVFQDGEFPKDSVHGIAFTAGENAMAAVAFAQRDRNDLRLLKWLKRRPLTRFQRSVTFLVSLEPFFSAQRSK
jgi:hypothetical protein